MRKKFNITGVCYPDRHYMMDMQHKMEQIMEMVEEGDYFVINRPRQYGKTTTLHLLGQSLGEQSDYLPIEMNFQGVDGRWHRSDQDFAQLFFEQFSDFLKYQQPTLTSFLEEEKKQLKDLDGLSKFITKLVHKEQRKIVLLIDEVDASANHAPFINFLGMLRTKFLKRYTLPQATFHSVILAGVHDIKSLKYRLSNSENEATKYVSPWNIAADFEVRMSFNKEEIIPMLEEYSKKEGVKMEVGDIAEKLCYYTSGYPFLVSKLCKIVGEKILPKKSKKTWRVADIEQAVQLLLKENNTNFDSLIKNLENKEDLYNLVYKLIIGGDNIPFNQYNPTIHQGILYGLFKNNGRLQIHNRIYEQLIYEYMTSKALSDLPSSTIYAGHFLLENNVLDMQAVLLKFQQFMKEQYSQRTSFLEEQGRLVFLAFLAPILNGQGCSFKEVQTSLEKRLDITVTYFQHRYILELKQWYGPKAHEKGLQQLADYLSIHGLSTGYLVIFDNRKKKNWKHKMIPFEEKEIFAVWV